jgi:methyl-accepting chemotaxis protein
LSILAAIAVLLAGAGAVIIWRAVVRPLAEITRVTEAVAEGAAAIAIPFGGRSDEIGALARSIIIFEHAMRDNEGLNRATRAAEERARHQEKLAATISQFNAEVETTLAKLGRICESMLGASTRLSCAAEYASTRTATATTASTEVSASVRDIALAVDELAASITEIDRQVAHSDSIAHQAVDEVEQTNATVKELDEVAARIGDVVDLITGIASQTNLLALNAAIEAARAGDAGRGFAVVAGEVKALAGETAKATENIGTQIGDMQHATLRSLEATFAIEKVIRQIGGISGSIAAAVSQQRAATHRIVRSAEIAAKRTVESVNEVERMGAAAADTRLSASAVKTVADDLSSVAAHIRRQIDQFFEQLHAA